MTEDLRNACIGGCFFFFFAALEPLEPPCEKPDGIGLLEHEPTWRED